MTWRHKWKKLTNESVIDAGRKMLTWTSVITAKIPYVLSV